MALLFKSQHTQVSGFARHYLDNTRVINDVLYQPGAKDPVARRIALNAREV